MSACAVSGKVCSTSRDVIESDRWPLIQLVKQIFLTLTLLFEKKESNYNTDGDFLM